MYKETITYTDFDGKERTEDFFFNLTKAELIEMELGTTGTMSNILDRIIKAKDTPDVIREIKKLLLKSYGVKSADGRYFTKSQDDIDRFEHSEPFSIMFMKLSLDDDAAAKFVLGIMPKDIAENIPPEALKPGVKVVPTTAIEASV